ATCSALYSNTGGGSAPGCAPGGGVPEPIIADVPAACGFPGSFPACNPAAGVVVRAGRTVLPPGVYGDVVVKSPGALASLELTGGSYVFCSLRIGRHAEVRVRRPSQ